MKRIFKAIVVLLLLAAGGLALFSAVQYTMVVTSSPQFCPTCHEIRPAYETWRTSTHVNNGQGLVAECADCHLPPLSDTLRFYYLKAYHGMKDLILHFALDQYDRERNRRTAYQTIKNRYCQKCHKNLLYIPNKRGAMLAHRSVIFARPGYEKKCLDCHRNLVHMPSGVYRYRQLEPPYRGLGT